MSRATVNRTSQLAAFIGKVMEPLPDAALIDTAYNSMVRNARLEPWRAAIRRADYYRGLLDAEIWADKVADPDVKLPTREVLLARWRKALVDALLTPAQRKADIDWKRRQLRYVPSCPVSAADVQRAIAEDDAFIAAHPTRRARR